MNHTQQRFKPYLQFCAQLRQQHLLRTLPQTQSFTYDFSSNDYLGLSQHPTLIQAAIRAAQENGVGSQASRLISSQQARVRALEKDVAQCKQTQAALIFATGYQANISALSALLDPKVLKSPALVFSDRLNHASFHAACWQAQAKQFRFAHLDYDHLQWALEKTKAQQQPKFILTESLFGMDGDIADLAQLIHLAKQYHAMLYVDDAHATGIYGQKGYGLTCDYGNEIDVVMGTFSKALGGSGAYVACSSSLKRYFINRCGGLIYSTAPSPMQIAAMHAAWELIPSLQPQAQQLRQNAEYVRKTLQQNGSNIGNSTTHIIPIIFREAAKTLSAQRFLMGFDMRASAIRPPSVPPLQSRLRIALNVHHDKHALHSLIHALRLFQKQI